MRSIAASQRNTSDQPAPLLYPFAMGARATACSPRNSSRSWSLETAPNEANYGEIWQKHDLFRQLLEKQIKFSNPISLDLLLPVGLEGGTKRLRASRKSQGFVENINSLACATGSHLHRVDVQQKSHNLAPARCL